MVFNSLVFLVFLALVLVLYYRLRFRAQNWMLILASYLFYGWWDYRFLSLLLFTTFFDFFCALRIENENHPRRRKLLLSASMAVNLGVLGVFKYFDFFASSLQQAFNRLGMSVSFPTLYVILPVGISFYTFLSMSYTIDVYRRELKATRNPSDFMLYVAFFPHLVAGPIVRASYLLPQCQKPRVIVPREVENGIWLIVMGYIKKVVIADRLAEVVSWGFSGQVPPLTDANSWLILYAFAFQIYGDFSGYSDIARGLSKLMGFELVENFRAPYLVTDASAFWRNWHISLSTWLRDYLYIPLGGNRNGAWKTYRNLFLTMLLGGLWHGAGAAYILWGGFHGGLLAVQRAWAQLTRRGEQPVRRGRLATFLLVLLFFHITCIGWLLFRAGALPVGISQTSYVVSYLKTLVVPPSHVNPLAQGILLLGLLGLFFQWKYDDMNSFSKWSPAAKGMAMGLALVAIATLGVFEGSQFIYFQF